MVNQAFIRNIGILAEEHQTILERATIGIAGVGADGGMVAERLARLGIGNLKIADPGLFDETNLNRQFGADLKAIGKNKAAVIARIIKRINPLIKLRLFKDGIGPSNIEKFVAGCDIVIDEIEYTRPDLSVLLHRAARKNNKYVFLGINVGWGANLFIFDPQGMTFEEYCGLPADIPFEEVRNYTIPLDRFCPKIPEYVPPSVIEDVLNGKEIPSISPACSLIASLVSTETALFLIDKKRYFPVVPQYINVDFFRRELNVGNNY